MMDNEPKCLYCEQDSNRVPLIALRFQRQSFWICPQHLPILIHHPEQLADKLLGAMFVDSPDMQLDE